MAVERVHQNLPRLGWAELLAPTPRQDGDGGLRFISLCFCSDTARPQGGAVADASNTTFADGKTAVYPNTLTASSSTKEGAGRVSWVVSVVGGLVWADNSADGAGQGSVK